MVVLAKEFVVRLGIFTNASDTSMLVVERRAGIGITTERMLVVFKNQMYQGLEVEDTEISVWLYADGARAIHGGWEAEIIIPDCAFITEEDAKYAALGTEIKYWSWGEPSTIIVSLENLQVGATMVVVPVIKDEKKELRLAWRFYVAFGWYLYIDVLDGAVLRTDQLWVS